jgi:hypothetical protein
VKSDLSAAEITLTRFFEYLNNKDYQQAARLYGGDYDNLWAMNPAIPPDDREALWESACEVNGFQCLPVLRIVSAQEVSAEEFLFMVEFASLDGERFELGSCCGAEDEDLAAEAQFRYHVDSINGEYLVREMPVYVP